MTCCRRYDGGGDGGFGDLLKEGIRVVAKVTIKRTKNFLLENEEDPVKNQQSIDARSRDITRNLRCLLFRPRYIPKVGDERATRYINGFIQMDVSPPRGLLRDTCFGVCESHGGYSDRCLHLHFRVYSSNQISFFFAGLYLYWNPTQFKRDGLISPEASLFDKKLYLEYTR